jgi:KDO2-lipid IV(A) lauroyltransferase
LRIREIILPKIILPIVLKAGFTQEKNKDHLQKKKDIFDREEHRMELAEKDIFSKIGYALMYRGVWLMSRIPLHAGQFLGRTLGRAVAAFGKGRITVSLDNLRYAFSDHIGEGGIRMLNRRVLMHFGEMLFEVPHILRLNHKNVGKYVIFENVENFLSAMDKGKGVFILTAHFGNWELMSAAFSLCFAPDSVIVARPIDSSIVDLLINNLRSRFGAEVIPKQRAMKRLLMAARENRTVGILLDQNVDWYEGVFVPFLGRPACTNKGLALIARRTGSPVVPTFSVKHRDGRYRIIFEKALELADTGDKTRDMEDNTALFNRVIEKYVRQYPDHWFWFHRRWKTKSYCPLP